MKGRKSNINDAGISLLELIIAVSIFAIAAVVFLQAFVTSGHGIKVGTLFECIYSGTKPDGRNQIQGL